MDSETGRDRNKANEIGTNAGRWRCRAGAAKETGAKMRGATLRGAGGALAGRGAGSLISKLAVRTGADGSAVADKAEGSTVAVCIGIESRR